MSNRPKCHYTFNIGDESYIIAFVIVFDRSDWKSDKNEENHKKFQNLLKTERNLILSEPTTEKNKLLLNDGKTEYYFVHIPDNVLKNYADFLGIKLPLASGNQFEPNEKISRFQRVINTFQFTSKQNDVSAMAKFRKDYPNLFDCNREDFFDERVRIQIASYILEMGSNKIDETNNSSKEILSLKSLLADKTYKSAFPLHDVILHSKPPDNKRHLRRELLKLWAKPRFWYKLNQPLDKIKDYFGHHVALYFAWLGFYTKMLVIASIVGIICLLYAIHSFETDPLSNDICNSDILMCPRCDKYCDYWELKDTCTYAKVQHFIDNPAIIFLAIFMSAWSALYLELWKRYSSKIRLRWGILDFDMEEEQPRVEYLKQQQNAKKEKPYKKYINMIFSFSFILMYICIALLSIFGIVMYKMVAVTLSVFYDDSIKSSFRVYLVPLTSSLISFAVMKMLDFPYLYVSSKLTNWEGHRTESDYENSLAVKIFMFQCVNYLTPLVYIGLIKGNFVGTPNNYQRIFGLRQEECIPGGCLVELTIQIVVVLVGLHVWSVFWEFGKPYFHKIYHRVNNDNKNQTHTPEKQLENDVALEDFPSQVLLSEYLEMILQYALITIFVTAFPIAPFIALINNVFETRLDANNLLTLYKRPVPKRVKDIGVWYWILQFIGQLSILTNSLLLAFSSHFVPKLVYVLTKNPNHNEQGFLDFSLSIFNTSDFEEGTAPIKSSYNVTTCRYNDFRKPPNSDNPYEYSLDFWHILAARLAFVVLYQNVVSFLVNFIDWFIADIPQEVLKEQREIIDKVDQTILESFNGQKNAKKEILKNLSIA